MKEQRFKSFFLSLLFSFVGILLPIQSFAQNKKAYAVLSEDGKTCTFRYDEQGDNYKAFEFGTDRVPDNTEKVIFEPSFKAYRPTSTEALFSDCQKLKEIIGIENLDTEDVTNMSYMFWRCYALTKLDLSWFETEKVTTMNDMFCGCYSLTELNLEKIKTDNVTDMHGMFALCLSLRELNLSGFKTDKVTDMSALFLECKSLIKINLIGLNTDKVEKMQQMFSHCQSVKNIDLSSFNTEKVTTMNDMFSECISRKTRFIEFQHKERRKYKLYV